MAFPAWQAWSEHQMIGPLRSTSMSCFPHDTKDCNKDSARTLALAPGLKTGIPHQSCLRKGAEESAVRYHILSWTGQTSPNTALLNLPSLSFRSRHFRLPSWRRMALLEGLWTREAGAEDGRLQQSAVATS